MTSSKRDNLDAPTTWRAMLAVVPGMSARKVAAVADAFPSMAALATATAAQLAALVVPPEAGAKKPRRLGPALGEWLAALL